MAEPAGAAAARTHRPATLAARRLAAPCKARKPRIMTAPDLANLLFDTPTGIDDLSVPAKTLLLAQDRIADRLYLIRKGALRLFFADGSGREISFQFFFEGDMVASFASLYRREPSLFSLESIEPTTLSVLGRDELFARIETTPAIRRAYEEKLADRFRSYQRLFLSRITKTPRQRYEALLEERPDIVRRVPQHYLASYLGITPVSLSRIRNRR